MPLMMRGGGKIEEWETLEWGRSKASAKKGPEKINPEILIDDFALDNLYPQLLCM